MGILIEMLMYKDMAYTDLVHCHVALQSVYSAIYSAQLYAIRSFLTISTAYSAVHGMVSVRI